MRRFLLGLGAFVIACSPRVFGEGEPRSAPVAQANQTDQPALAEAPAEHAEAPACGAPIATGDRVICNWMAHGVYYPGRVDSTDSHGGVTIQYDDGDRERTVAARCLKEPAGAHVLHVPNPTRVATPDPDGIAGQYRIAAAANPGGGAGYTGNVSIARDGDVYHLGWTIPGSAGYVGVGLHVGGVLGVGWSTGGMPGVVVYQVKGGHLDGKWAAGTGNGLGVEVLDGPAGLSGKYRITKGENPGGGSYTGSVKITRKGDVYQLAWTIPGSSYAGLGILKGDVLSVGWGQGSPPGVVAYAVNRPTLDGVWANPSDTRLGKERLERK